MTIDDFLAILEKRDLVPAAIVKKVRAKVEQGDRRITPKSLLKYLVKKELVTHTQAKQLLETTLTVTPSAESSILGIVPLPEVPAEQLVRKEPKPEEMPTIAPVEPDAGSRVTKEARERVEAEESAARMSEIITDSFSTGEIEQPLTEQAEEGTKKRRKKKKGKKNEWDSSLILLGGGGLVLLIVAGVIIYYLLTRENADAVLAEASEFFDGGSYTQAIKQYERFVENHPNHPEYSKGKVKLGMAKLWKASSSTSDYSNALNTAQSVLDEIQDEKEFNSAHRDLASLLPKIAQGLANQAEQAEDPKKIRQLIEEVNLALSLCNNTRYVTTKFRDKILMKEIGQTLERVERGLQENANLTKGLAEIETAVQAGDIASAYAIHERLIDENSGLLNNKKLAEKVLEISAAESGAVKFVAESMVAETSERPSTAIAALALADSSGSPTTGAEGQLAVRAGGAVFALSADNGSLMWRRYVGHAPELPPLLLPGGDVLVVDQRFNELLRLAGNRGKLAWRLSLDAPLCKPVMLDERILLADQLGKLHVIDSRSGERVGFVQFPQPLTTPPAIGPNQRRVYQAGDHSSLYVLSTEDFSCAGVYFLGHAKGAVSAPPVTVLNKVAVAVTTGLATSRLHLLNTSRDGIPQSDAATRRLDGLVSTPLLVDGRRLVAMTTTGQVAVYTVGPNSDAKSLTPVATRESESGEAVVRFGLLYDGHVWAAGRRLNKLAVLPTSDRLPVRNVDQVYEGDTFDHPLQAIGGALVYVRRPAGKSGSVVGAVEMSSGKSLWRTELGVAPAGPPAIDPTSTRISALSATGDAYLLDRQAMSRRVQDEARTLSTSQRRKVSALTTTVNLGSGRIAAGRTGSKTVLLFRPSGGRKSLTTIELPSPLSAPLVNWNGAFVAATEEGQVFAYSGKNGESVASPFQPPLEPNTQYNWLTPAVTSGGVDASLVMSNGTTRIYLVSQVAEPEPHFASTAESDVGPSPLNTRLTIVGNLVFAGTDDGRLALFKLPALEAQPLVDLGAQITWGPFTVGDRAVFATDTEELVGIDSTGQISWRKPLKASTPTGTPLAAGSDLLVLFTSGKLARLQLGSGNETASIKLDEPPVAGPVAFGERLVVSTADGTLVVLNQP